MANRKLAPLLLLIVFISGVGNTFFIGGVLRPFMLDRSGLDISYHSLIIALSGLLSLIIIFKQPNIAQNKLYTYAYLIGILMVIGFGLNIPQTNILIMITGATIIHATSYLLNPIISELVNLEANSKHRATTISTANLFDQLGYIIAVPLIGIMVSRQQLGRFIFGLTIIMILSITFSFLLRSKAQKNKVLEL